LGDRTDRDDRVVLSLDERADHALARPDADVGLAAQHELVRGARVRGRVGGDEFDVQPLEKIDLEETDVVGVGRPGGVGRVGMGERRVVGWVPLLPIKSGSR